MLLLLYDLHAFRLQSYLYYMFPVLFYFVVMSHKYTAGISYYLLIACYLLTATFYAVVLLGIGFLLLIITYSPPTDVDSLLVSQLQNF